MLQDLFAPQPFDPSPWAMIARFAVAWLIGAAVAATVLVCVTTVAAKNVESRNRMLTRAMPLLAFLGISAFLVSFVAVGADFRAVSERNEAWVDHIAETYPEASGEVVDVESFPKMFVVVLDNGVRLDCGRPVDVDLDDIVCTPIVKSSPNVESSSNVSFGDVEMPLPFFTKGGLAAHLVETYGLADVEVPDDPMSMNRWSFTDDRDARSTSNCLFDGERLLCGDLTEFSSATTQES